MRRPDVFGELIIGAGNSSNETSDRENEYPDRVRLSMREFKCWMSR